MNFDDIVKFLDETDLEIEVKFCGYNYGLYSPNNNKILINVYIMVVETFVHEMLHDLNPMEKGQGEEAYEMAIENAAMEFVTNLKPDEIIELSRLILGGEI